MTMKKNENRLGYKKTKVGWIPTDWTLQTIESLCSVHSGGTPSKGNASFWSGSKPWVSAKDLKTPVITESQDRLTDEGFSHAHTAPTDSLLILIRGMTLFRDVPVCRAGRDVAFNQDIKALCTKGECMSAYLQCVMHAQKGRLLGLVDAAGHGTGRIDTGELKAFSIPLPSLPEQEAIAGVLECWDRAIRAYETKIEKKRNIKKGLMQRLLTGKQRLPGFATTENTEGHGKKKDGIPRGWERAQLRDICDLQSGKFMAASAISKVRTEDSFPCFGGNGLRGYVGSRSHNGEYALIGRQGALCGNVCWASGEFYATEHAVVATPVNNTSSKWLYYQLEHLNLNRFATGVAQPGLSVQILDQVVAPVPSPAEQRAIAAVLSSADAEIATLERKLAVLREQKRYLLNNLVTGTIRLPEFTKAGRESTTRNTENTKKDLDR